MLKIIFALISLITQVQASTNNINERGYSRVLRCVSYQADFKPQAPYAIDILQEVFAIETSENASEQSLSEVIILTEFRDKYSDAQKNVTRSTSVGEWLRAKNSFQIYLANDELSLTAENLNFNQAFQAHAIYKSESKIDYQCQAIRFMN